MSRASRLLELLQVLRRHRAPVQGASLARELGVSLRTLYRDIATLQSQGANIAGEAGLGYVLRPGYLLPPLMFSKEELESLVLGSRWVVQRGDSRLASAAKDVLAKVGAILPDDLRRELDTSGLLVSPPPPRPEEAINLAGIRDAIRSESKLAIRYRDEKGGLTERIIWPFALGYFERARIIVAWCELRIAFRHFRTDRVESFHPRNERYPRRRAALLAEWRETEVGRGRS